MHSLSRALRPMRAVLLFLLLAPAAAQLLWSDGSTATRTIVALPSFGDGEKHLTVLYRLADGDVPADNEPDVSTSDLYTVGDPIISSATNGYTNYTYTLSLTGDVGSESLTVTAGPSETLSATFIAAGFVIKDSSGKIVSGDAGEGVTVGIEGQTEYDVDAVGTDGKSVDLSGTSIDARPGSGNVYMQELDEEETGFSGDKFILAISKLRAGTGNFVVSFETTAIEYKGESFETVLHVKQDLSGPIPCVVDGDELVSRSGTLEATMFNLLTPPLDTPVKEIVLSIGGSSIPYDTDASSLILPTSSVVFSGVLATGSAKITCDGEDAVVIKDGEVVSAGLTVTSADGEPLAKDTLVKPLPSSDTLDLLTSTIRVVDSSPTVLTQSEGQAILDEYCKTLSSTDCAIANITEGSARLFLGGLVSDEAASTKTLSESFSSCTFQTNTKYACDKLELETVQTVNASAGAAVGTAGIATWTIVLISCVGAFALIAVVVLTLWAVHRRSSQLSESSYSSSGPLGVPDPSDLLYEQSIVRDVYGRGEDGGPTLEAAEKSERVATLRDAVQRPPSSSSGLSRDRAASLDASSTYSV